MRLSVSNKKKFCGFLLPKTLFVVSATTAPLTMVFTIGSDEAFVVDMSAMKIVEGGVESKSGKREIFETQGIANIDLAIQWDYS